ncbi:uncharacterized protein BDZ99DRAFT_565750 [Mytilinidion resinicola]|uniref:Uncharacterized protein n=1 Tax=Mytilinidion resinicola TaxID=574789 RepID=A0A6A6Z6G4_9PEZI|nr:uncharacterized protein BDZ99DRAFT_565750 [Mytilinidion resinicola]KAF2815825.1 hypothetical protein BDZ99DRAFT_565750 [Mytilinidion resinicola]
MGIGKPPLPAPTEASSIDNDTTLGDDFATDVSRRTDKTSYSIPEDGSPVTISTSKNQPTLRGAHPSQTSLLIEYFEAGKGEGKVHSRPSVRVRVTPSSHRKSRSANDHIQITQTSRSSRKPSYTRRISLGAKSRDEPVSQATEVSLSEDSNLSARPPVEVEVLENVSDLSRSDLSHGRYIPATSDISSMPPDSLLEGEPIIRAPEIRSSRSTEREEVIDNQNTLSAPSGGRGRSLSKERITQRVMEKLTSKQAETKLVSGREGRASKEELSDSGRSARRRNSKTHHDEDVVSATDSMLSSNLNRRSGDTHSMRSGVSAASSSINNPRLLQTVEDAIKRLILPELNALKEEKRTQQNRSKFDHNSRESAYESIPSTSSRETSSRRVSKSSSAPNVAALKPKVVLNQDEDHPGVVLSGNSTRKEGRSRRGSTSSRSHDRRDSTDSIGRGEEKAHSRRTKDRHRSRDAAAAGLVGVALTANALRHHDSRESTEEKSERRRRRKSSRSRSTSVSETVDGKRHLEAEIPPMPLLQSELQGSELTRESIISASTERPVSRSSVDVSTPVQEVARGSGRQIFSSTPSTPTRTPVALQRGLNNYHSNLSQGDISLTKVKSDRSLASTGRVAVPGAIRLGASGTSVKERALTQEPVSQYEYAEKTPPREFSPVQSIASYQDGDDRELRHLPSTHSPVSLSSTGRRAHRQRSTLSIGSMESSPSTKMAHTRKRPQGVNLEKSHDALDEDMRNKTQQPQTPRDVDDFFAENHEQNEAYRRELENNSPQGSPVIDYKHMTNYTDDSGEGQYLDKVALGQDIRGVGANPEYVHTPLAVESAVASLHEPSTLSVRSSQPSPLKGAALSPVSSFHHEGPSQEQQSGRFQEESDAAYPDNGSRERWGSLKDQAHTLSQTQSRERSARNSPQHSISRSIDEPVQLGASAFPVQDDMLPEFGYGMDDESVTTNPSIIKGPIGGGDYHDQHWHTEPTPPMSSVDVRGHDDQEGTASRGAVATAGLGAGAVAIAAAAAARIQREKGDSSTRLDRGYQPSVEDEYDLQNAYQPKGVVTPGSPTLWKDEGYMSANQPGAITPDYQNRSRHFEDDVEEDPFTTSNKHIRHFSGNSHGMSSPLYDGATGRGIDKIQSKDVVALMDHLTVRDGQRNARDTEILVTLVRSAAEMRNSFEEMKRYIADQDRLIMANTDKRVDVAEQRILQGPRPQPLGSPRVPRQSSEGMSDIQAQKKNILKRALRGLSMKGNTDLSKIEDMLTHLLSEVEVLKDNQAFQLRQPMTQSNSLNSYENLRAGGDPGYEPEGQAGTSSSPNHSGYLSNPSSRKIDGMHSGYDGRRGSEHRISTVLEGDEDLDGHEPHLMNSQDENDERLLTPTQEVRRKVSLPLGTPPQPTQPLQGQHSQENTPKRKHKSNSSSIFGFPKNLSRWSKTTTSTVPDSAGRNSGSRDKRPYSDASRSGSNLNVNYYDDNQYELRNDDRLRSSHSLDGAPAARDLRSPSPLIPEDEHGQRGLVPELDDPKYQAHRNSLNLQHPQPRPGPTHRHQSHLESQAQVFEPVASPDFDQWGSNPSLARNRLSGGNASTGAGNLSPISSDGGYSQHSAAEQAAPPRPPKIRDDGPLVPQQQPLAGHGQTRQMYSSPGGMGSQGQLTPLAPIQEVRYSLETDTGHHYSPTPSPRPTNATLNASNAMQNPQRKITGPRPMGSRSPSGQPQQQEVLFDNSGTVRRKPVARPMGTIQKALRATEVA